VGYETVSWDTYQEINGEWTVKLVSAAGAGGLYRDAAQWVGFNHDSNEVPSTDHGGKWLAIGTEVDTDFTQIGGAYTSAGCISNAPPLLPTRFAWVRVEDQQGYDYTVTDQHGNQYSGTDACGAYLFPVNVGDDIVASVSLSGSTAYLAIDDTTLCQGVTPVSNCAYDKVLRFNNPGGYRLRDFTGDWIVQRTAWECVPLLAPQHYAFSNALVKATNGIWYTMTYARYYAVAMQEGFDNPPPTIATPSGLSNNGTSFSINVAYPGDSSRQCEF
jgi:hypothetical protein